MKPVAAQNRHEREEDVRAGFVMATTVGWERAWRVRTMWHDECAEDAQAQEEMRQESKRRQGVGRTHFAFDGLKRIHGSLNEETII